MQEHGRITFLGETYELKDCKAAYFRDQVQFECSGPDVFFSFYKLRIRNAESVASYQDYNLSSDNDDGDLGDYAKFTFFDKDCEFDGEWEVTCLTANQEKGVMAFEWNFVILYGSGRIPKRKRMRGSARCSLTIY